MPNIKSSIKRVKINEKKKNYNRMVKSDMRTAIKKFDSELAADYASGQKQLSLTTSKIDKAAAKGVIHKNAANRKKSQLARQLASNS